MTFLPIVARELRVASRRRSTFWVRIGAAVAVIIIGTFFFLLMQRDSPNYVAKTLFGILTGSAVLYSLLSGIRDTSDCLSIEKREGTLGLLFLTDLKGYDVVIGKMVANSLNAFYGVLAVLPMLAVPLLMGGVTLGEFGRTALVVVNTLFYSLTVGLCMSAMSRSGRKAASLTFVLLLLFAAVLPGMGLWLALVSNARQPELFLLAASPIANYVIAWDYFYKSLKMADEFWICVGVNHAIGWLFLVLASFVAPRSWQDRPAGVQRLRWRERWQLWSLGNIIERQGFRRQLLNINAFFWLAARARLKPAMAWGGLGIFGCAWAFGLSRFHRDWLNPLVYVLTGIVLSIALKAWFATEAGRQLAEDRRRGALELLLSTPMTVEDIMHGQLLALRRQFFGPLIVIMIVACLFLAATLNDITGSDDRSMSLLFWLGGMLTLVGDLVSLYWVCMWMALVAKNPNRAASASVGRVLVLPAVAWCLLLLLVSLNSMRGGFQPSATFLLGSWFVLGLAADVGFSFWARHKLLTEFRLAAMQRYTPQPGFWKRLWSGSEPQNPDLPPVAVASE